jgi:hypothetical protein
MYESTCQSSRSYRSSSTASKGINLNTKFTIDYTILSYKSDKFREFKYKAPEKVIMIAKNSNDGRDYKDISFLTPIKNNKNFKENYENIMSTVKDWKTPQKDKKSAGEKSYKWSMKSINIANDKANRDYKDILSNDHITYDNDSRFNFINLSPRYDRNIRSSSSAMANEKSFGNIKKPRQGSDPFEFKLRSLREKSSGSVSINTSKFNKKQSDVLSLLETPKNTKYHKPNRLKKLNSAYERSIVNSFY